MEAFSTSSGNPQNAPRLKISQIAACLHGSDVSLTKTRNGSELLLSNLVAGRGKRSARDGIGGEARLHVAHPERKIGSKALL